MIITGPPHDPQFHCALFGLLIAVGAYLLGASSVYLKWVRSENDKPQADQSS
jgi:hypothetical protein